MKKIFLSSLMLLSMALMFTACEDDRDSNPTMLKPNGFTLNNPVNTLVDLGLSEVIPFTWSQPDFGGWPAAVEYQLEVSPTGDWNYSTDEAADSEDGSIVADYAILPTVYASCKGEMSAIELDRALVSVCKWEEDNVPEKQTVYVRCRAITAGTSYIWSNVVSLEVNPYYIELADADIELWYLVGSGIGSSDWDNGADKIGTGLIPMYPIMGNEYSKLTGQGEIQYAGYFNAGMQFKLIRVPGDWGDQLNFTNVANPGSFISDEDGDNHNIGIVEAGYYHILLNTATRELVIKPLETAVSGVYTQIGMPGGYQPGDGWDVNGNVMNAMSTSVENHDWYLTKVTYSENTELKFAADGAWDVNWGAQNFPYGIGTQGGANIPVAAGTYNVYFNDILGTYNFVAVK